VWSTVMSVSVCLSLCPLAYLRPHILASQNFLYMSTVATAQSSSDDNTICYVLPILWMTSGKGEPIGCILKVTHQGAEPGAKSGVYDCLVLQCCLCCGNWPRCAFTENRIQCKAPVARKTCQNRYCYATVIQLWELNMNNNCLNSLIELKFYVLLNTKTGHWLNLKTSHLRDILPGE